MSVTWYEIQRIRNSTIDRDRVEINARMLHEMCDLAESAIAHPEPAQAQVSVPVHQLAHEIVRYFSPFMDCGPVDAEHEIQIRSLISEALSAPLPDGRS